MILTNLHFQFKWHHPEKKMRNSVKSSIALTTFKQIISSKLKYSFTVNKNYLLQSIKDKISFTSSYIHQLSIIQFVFVKF